MKKEVYIVVVGGSPIINEGLNGILRKSGINYHISFVSSVEEINQHYINDNLILIVNPSIIKDSIKTLKSIRQRFGEASLIGLVYAYHDPKVLSAFDALITLSDSQAAIAATINRMNADKNKQQTSSQEILSERETEVIKLLVEGLSNKEIADKLNISINTVITHRKNISQKTGIKSVSGLTIYAVLQNIVPLEPLK